MSLRYETVPSDVEEFVNYVVRNTFPQLNTANFEMAFDLKKKKSGGRHQLAKLEKPNEVMRFVSSDETKPEGIDYILILDKNVWIELSEDDRKRLIRHTLQHADVDFEKEMPYGTRKPEVATFYAEIEYNKDDPQWMERLENIAESVYDREREQSE